MALTVAAVKAARPAARPYKLADERSLYLLVAPTGTKSFRMKYRYERREQLLTFGTFPEISLTEARALRDTARDQLRQGENPAAAKRREATSSRTASTVAPSDAFEPMARRWHAHQRSRWSPVHAVDVLTSLERDAFPAIGGLALASIDPPTVLRMLRDVEARGSLETARRLRQRISSIFALAISEGHQGTDPATIVAKALRAPTGAQHHPALLDIVDARGLLDACEFVDASIAVKLASRLLALTAVRLSAVRGATWEEFEGIDWHNGIIEAPAWRIPAARMKMAVAKKRDPKLAHVVPLSGAAVEVLRAARRLHTDYEGCALVFRGRVKSAAIGEAAIGALYARAGFAGRHVPHGWRASFSTIMFEAYPQDRLAIDRALAHKPKDMTAVEAAYNRAQQLDRRRWLFDRWAELLYPDVPG